MTDVTPLDDSEEAMGWIGQRIMSFAQRQTGTAKLEETTPRDLARGVWGRILQWAAMSALPLPPSLRVGLQRHRGVHVGEHVFIGIRVFMDPVRPDLITIGDYVSLAGNDIILTHSDPTAPLREILGPEGKKFAPVVFERGAWVTVNCVILPGVTIGENSIVAAGSVVTKDVPPFTIVGGVPAKPLRRLKEHK